MLGPVLAAVGDAESVGRGRVADLGLAARQVVDKIGVDIDRHPVGAQRNRHVLGRPGLGLHRLQGAHVERHAGRLGRLELALDHAGQVHVGGFVLAALGILEHQRGIARLQLAYGILDAHAAQGGNALHVHATRLGQHDGQRIGARIGRSSRLVLGHHALAHDRRRGSDLLLRRQAGFLGLAFGALGLVADFQGGNQAAVRHGHGQVKVDRAVDRAELGHKLLIGLGQLGPVGLHGFRVGVLRLHDQLSLEQVAQAHHAAQARIGRGAQAQAVWHILLAEHLAGVDVALARLAVLAGLLDVVAIRIQLGHQSIPAALCVQVELGGPGALRGQLLALHLVAAFGRLALDDTLQLAIFIDLEMADFLVGQRNAQRVAHALESLFRGRHDLGIQAVDVHGQARDRLGQHVAQPLRVVQAHSHVVLELHGARTLQRAHDVLRVARQVAVDAHRLAAQRVGHQGSFYPGRHPRCQHLLLRRLVAVLVAAALVGVNDQIHLGLLGRRQLLQDHDVSDHFGAGVFLERCIGQADQADQAGFGSQSQARALVLGVHQVT